MYRIRKQLKKIKEIILADQANPKSEKDVILLFSILKSDKTLSAVTLLCKNNYGEDSAILSRSLFELSLNVKYIFSSDDDLLAERFIAYDWVARSSVLESVIFSNNLTEESLQRIAIIKENAEKVCKDYNIKDKRSWSDKNIKEMAEACGWTEIYLTAYKIQCALSHPNSRSINYYLKEEYGYSRITKQICCGAQ